MADRSLLRAGAAAGVIGGVLALVGNLLHPRYGDIADVDIYRKVAASDRYRISDLILVVALLLTIAAFLAVARFVEAGGASSALAGYGRVAAVVGGAIAVAEIGMETYGLKQQAQVFAGANAQNRVGAFWATNSIDHLNTALFGTWTVVFLGVAPLLVGLATLRGRRQAAWLGALAAVGGVVCVVVGFINLMRTDQTATQVPFLIGSLLVTVWIVAASVDLWRRAQDMVVQVPAQSLPLDQSAPSRVTEAQT